MKDGIKEIKHRWVWLGAVTAVGLAIDLVTKYLAYTRLEAGVPVPVIGEYLMWKLVYNEGAIFGTDIPALMPWLPPNVFFIAFMACAIGFLLFYYKRLRKDEVLLHWGLMIVVPGALGNFHDRIVHGEKGVVDFILMGIPPSTYWFIYNVADIFVTAGVGMMLLYFLLDARKKTPPKDESQSQHETAAP